MPPEFTDRELLVRIDAKLDMLVAGKSVISSSRSTPQDGFPAPVCEIRITDKDATAKVFNNLSPEYITSDLELRFSSWLYRWECDIFNQCSTQYVGDVYVLQKSTGRNILWNHIESATIKSPGIPYWSTDGFHWVRKDSETVSFGFVENKRSNFVSTCVNCFTDGYSVSWRWDANAP